MRNYKLSTLYRYLILVFLNCGNLLHAIFAARAPKKQLMLGSTCLNMPGNWHVNADVTRQIENVPGREFCDINSESLNGKTYSKCSLEELSF